MPELSLAVSVSNLEEPVVGELRNRVREGTPMSSAPSAAANSGLEAGVVGFVESPMELSSETVPGHESRSMVL